MASEVASGSGKQKFPFSLRGIVGRKEFGGAVIENNQHFFRIVRSSPNDPATTSQHPTIRVGVVFVGRQFPEGNSVLRGLLTALKASNRDNSLFGFKAWHQARISDTVTKAGKMLATTLLKEQEDLESWKG
ncbi:hypothetical protein GIB67_012029 [Kingdonia uniflora]|uniref:Uncharacterized protein n=1 Tax=Kingdonia uniflora TaxID=39325 RepID=A0A7J7M0C4_9MAGN|nr:hypothetical protein GIB67_012029 [Kingdonia uniflora]